MVEVHAIQRVDLLRGYVRQSVASRRAGRVALGDAVRWSRPWYQSHRGATTPLAEERPWVTYAAREFLDGVVTGDPRVFEWGAGGSTLFFARRAASVVTVEHDPGWLDLVRERIEAIAAATWVGHLVVPMAGEGGGDPSDPDAFTSRHAAHRAHSFRAYVDAVNEHADESLDLVMVDGRARPSCVVAGAPKVRPGGLLVLDDSHRPTYQRVQASAVLDGWERHDFFGPAPRSRRFVCTTAWRRPDHR